MTYGNRFRECSGYCSGWQPFWLDYGEIAGLPQLLESPLHGLAGLDRTIAVKPRCSSDQQSA
jgi:hypothetical protein